MEKKSVLRLSIISKLDSLKTENKREKDKALFEKLKKIILPSDKKIALYFPLKREVNIFPYILYLFSQYTKLYFPVFYTDDKVLIEIKKKAKPKLYFVSLSLKEFEHIFQEAGIPFPFFNIQSNNFDYASLMNLNRILLSMKLQAEIPDIFFIPCLGLNTDKYRLGYGSAYYDSFFSDNSLKESLLYSVLYPFQLNLPFKEEKWDLRVYKIIF